MITCPSSATCTSGTSEGQGGAHSGVAPKPIRASASTSPCSHPCRPTAMSTIQLRTTLRSRSKPSLAKRPPHGPFAFRWTRQSTTTLIIQTGGPPQVTSRPSQHAWLRAAIRTWAATLGLYNCSITLRARRPARASARVHVFAPSPLSVGHSPKGIAQIQTRVAKGILIIKAKGIVPRSRRPPAPCVQ
jgi:hypothetical protein